MSWVEAIGRETTAPLDETLTDAIEDVCSRLKLGEYTDEAKVSDGIVRRFLHRLGWPVYDTSTVVPQYAIRRRKVDFALVGTDKAPAVLLEVKKVGNIEAGEEQLFEYAYQEGTQVVVLTDGQRWRFYLSGAGGEYRSRCYWDTDLLSVPPSEVARSLHRYLDHGRVCGAEALRTAWEDLDDRKRQRKAIEVLPEAWRGLIRSEELKGLLRSRVEKMCGVAPSEESVARFLRGTRLDPPPPPPPPPTSRNGASFTFGRATRRFRTNAEVLVGVFTVLAQRDPGFLGRFDARHSGRKRVSRNLDDLDPGRRKAHARLPGGWWIDAGMPNKGGLIEKACQVAGLAFGRDLIVRFRKRPPSPPSPSRPPPREDRQVQDGPHSYTLDGETRRFRKSADLLGAIFAVFAENDPRFCEEFRRRHRGRTREYVAKSPEDLYPGSPHLAKSEFRELPGGYFIGTNMGTAKKMDLIRWACEVAGVRFGQDLTVELPVAQRAKKQP